MPFREKISWLSLGGILLAFGPYFAMLLSGTPPWALNPISAAWFIGMVSVLATVMAVGTIGVALTNLREAQRPSDERDRMIARRASSIAYAVLAPALWLALATLFVSSSLSVLVNAVLAAIVVAEVVRCAAEIAGYRRGWHG
ncbi:hypothetical protein [Sphingomonas sp. MS122]|uniref:hypothetical protein n=1 Tax=Sphingomonas sp. MS122 TaxID=3412683 RepID=UPI003C2C0CAF